MPVNEIYMSNTKTLAIVAVLTAATLVIGVTFAATTQSAFAAAQKGAQDKKQDKKQDPKGKDRGNNGNTVTEQENKQKGIQSGWDNDFEQEGTNVICTHPEGLFACLSTD